jgi:hypothetical protein
MCKNRVKSPSDLLPHPSAIFTPIDDAERRICDVNPYSSSLGNARVTP